MKNKVIKGFIAIVIFPFVVSSPAAQPPADISTQFGRSGQTDDVMRFDVPSESAISDVAGGMITEQLLQQLEMQYFYIKHLDNVKHAMEKELSIARIKRECEQLGMLCTGDGLVESLPYFSSPPPLSPPEPAEPPELAEPPKPETDIPDWFPVVQGVAGEGAWIDYRQRRFYVKGGMRVGDWMVRSVSLDHLVFERDGRKFTVPVRWNPGEQNKREAKSGNVARNKR